MDDVKRVGKLLDNKGEKEAHGDLVYVMAIQKEQGSYHGIISSDDDLVKGKDFLNLAKLTIKLMVGYAEENGIDKEEAKAELVSFIAF